MISKYRLRRLDLTDELRAGPPVFGDEYTRWSLGSFVLAHWWCHRTLTEKSAEGVVAGLTKGGPEGWLVTISFGPAFDLLSDHPAEFNPSQVTISGT